MIEFLCPEGHKIRCPKEKAGRPAKCPQVWRGLSYSYHRRTGFGGIGRSRCLLGGRRSDRRPRGAAFARRQRKAARRSAPSKERQIEFLCPNGHHLHGPASLQGRAGECPECGSRFRIPIIDEPEAEPTPAEPEVPPSRKSLPRKKSRWRVRRPLAEPEPCPIGGTAGFLASHGRRQFRAGETARHSGGLGRRFSICLPA